MRRLGSVWVVPVVILVVLVVVGIWYISAYNKAVRLEKAAESAWANVEAALQRRFDLVPNLVETVKGYATHEKELFENVAKARQAYTGAGTRDEKIQAANMLSGFLPRLLAIAEAYPELKASENFRDLQVALEGTENRINVARQRYNDAVRQLNTYAKEFFGRYFCRKAGVKPAPYFEATEKAKTEVPQVKFD